MIVSIGLAHEEIIQWWTKMSLQKPIKCQVNQNYTTAFHPIAEKFLSKVEPIPIITSKPCPCFKDDKKYFKYDFKGNIKMGQLEGPGKLKIFASNNNQYSCKFDETCIETNGLLKNKRNLKITGTFKNGTLHGVAKIVFEDQSTMISNFVNGALDGPERLWDSNNRLYSYSFKKKSKQKSKCWKADKNYLFWSDCSFVLEDAAEPFSTILIPFDTKKEILVGNVNTIGSDNGNIDALVEDLFSAKIEMINNDHECFLMLNWDKKERKDFKLSLHRNGNQKQLPLNYVPNKMCHDPNQFTTNKTAKEQFEFWENFINDTFIDGFENGYEVLNLVKPEPSSTLELDLVQQKFISSSITIFISKNIFYANMSHWNGKSLPWRALEIHLDTNGNLHGKCSFLLEMNNWNTTGRHTLLNWSLKYFSGEFFHGKLHGLALLITWDGANIFATFQNGELHGPVFAFGTIPIYDMAVSVFLKKNL